MESIRSIADLVNDQAMNLFLNELAAKIIDGLNRLFLKYDKGAAERWVWELLQNAKDSSIGQDRVKVEIILTDTYVEFKHSGKPFTINDLQSLIHQTSQKERIQSASNNTAQQQPSGMQAKRQADALHEAECEKIIDGPVPENTGKFGTGFLTTHLLSRIVEISGIYQNAFDSQKYHRFSITLDRSSEEKDVIIQKYKAAFTRLKSFDDEQVCPTVDNFIPGENCDSSFKYILEDERGQKTAARGIANFYKCISHVLTFNPKFESIFVKDERTNREKLATDDLQGEFLFRVIERKSLNAKIDLIKIENGKNGSIEHILIATENSNLQICLPISDKFRVLKRPEDQPTLFVDYPLVGSHTFAYPCVINSHIFLPDEERSSVILEYSRLSTLNKALLKRATTLYHTLIHFICKSKNPVFKSKTSGMIMSGVVPSGVEEQWYLKNFLNPTIQSIFSLNIVKTVSGHKLPIYEVIIPEITHAASYDGYGRQKITMEEGKLKALWEILNAFNCKGESQISSLIKYEVKDISKWFGVLSNPNWQSQLRLKNPQWCFQTLFKVIDCIEQSSTLQHLSKELQMEEEQATDLINLVLLFIEKHCLDQVKDQILKNRRILFNQKGVFVYNKDLFIDENIDEGYKNLLLKQKYDIRHELLHKNIKNQMLNNYLKSQSMYNVFILIRSRISMTANDFYYENQRKGRVRITNPREDLNVLDQDSQFKLVLDLLKMIPEETDEEKKRKIQPQENQVQAQQIKKTDKEEEKQNYHEHRMKFLKWAYGLKQLQNAGLGSQGHTIVKVKSEDIFNICEAIVIQKVYEVIQQAKKFDALKNSISQQDGLNWLEYFYEQFNEKILNESSFRYKINQGVINQKFIELDQNLNFNVNNGENLKLDIVDQDQKLAPDSQNLIERLINLHQTLKIKTLEKEKIQGQPQPQYSLKSTLIHKRFNKYFKNLLEYKLLDLCKDADNMLKELAKSSEFIKNNKQHVFEINKLAFSLFKIEENKKGVQGNPVAEEYFPQYMMNRKSLIADVMSGELSESLNCFFQNGMIDMLKDLGGMNLENQQQVGSLVNSLNNPENQQQNQMIKKLLADKDYAKKLIDLEQQQKANAGQQLVGAINIQQQEPNPRQFFAWFNIQNDSQLTFVLADLKSKKIFNVFSDEFLERMKAAGNREAYEYVQKIMGYALKTIKDYLMKQEKYDTTNWQASGHDQNIIKGVLKEGKPIVILIRPTDGNKIIFHMENEKNALTSDESELWGCDEHRAPELITFGKVLKWNNINQINLVPQMFM